MVDFFELEFGNSFVIDCMLVGFAFETRTVLDHITMDAAGKSKYLFAGYCTNNMVIGILARPSIELVIRLSILVDGEFGL